MEDNKKQWSSRKQAKMIKSEQEIRLRKFKFFVQYLTLQIVLTERKTSIITVFLKLLKIMAKKA